MEVYRNMSLYKHNIGTCNFTEFDSHHYSNNIIRTCGSVPKTCPKDCKHYVDKMNRERCRKGFEKKMQDSMMWMTSNKTALAVWKAISVCANTVVDSPAANVQPSLLLGIFCVLLCALVKLEG